MKSAGVTVVAIIQVQGRRYSTTVTTYETGTGIFGDVSATQALLYTALVILGVVLLCCLKKCCVTVVCGGEEEEEEEEEEYPQQRSASPGLTHSVNHAVAHHASRQASPGEGIERAYEQQSDNTEEDQDRECDNTKVDQVQESESTEDQSLDKIPAIPPPSYEEVVRSNDATE